jgi:hypothetical protein
MADTIEMTPLGEWISFIERAFVIACQRNQVTYFRDYSNDLYNLFNLQRLAIAINRDLEKYDFDEGRVRYHQSNLTRITNLYVDRVVQNSFGRVGLNVSIFEKVKTEMKANSICKIYP